MKRQILWALISLCGVSLIACNYAQQADVAHQHIETTSNQVNNESWKQAAVDLLSTMDSLFTQVAWANWAGAVTEQTEIRFYSGYPYTRFYDRYDSRIYEAPWIYPISNHYASSFSLFNLNGDDIPEILIHFSQTFEGCYGGFYRIFRYTEGVYQALEMVSYSENQQTPWVRFGSVHQLLIDGYGRTIVFVDCPLQGMDYRELVIVDSRAEFHYLLIEREWYAWQEHHWEDWEVEDGHVIKLMDSWLNHNPTIFGTDIPLTPLQPLTDLENQIISYAIQRRSDP